MDNEMYNKIGKVLLRFPYEMIKREIGVREECKSRSYLGNVRNEAGELDCITSGFLKDSK